MTLDHTVTRRGHLELLRQLADEYRTRLEEVDISSLKFQRELRRHHEELDVSTSQLAEDLRLCHPTVVSLISAARGRFTGLENEGTVPSIDVEDIAKFAQEYGNVSRVIGDVWPGRVIYGSGVALQRFRSGGGRLECQHLLLRFGSYVWAQVERTYFGSGATGTGNTRRALTLAGLDKGVAEDASWRNGINYALDTSSGITEVEPGTYPPDLPRFDPEGYLVAQVPSPGWTSAEDLLRRWANFLANPDRYLPWTDGPRRISVYPTAAAAEAHGFVDGHYGTYQIIVEQGDLQIRIAEYCDRGSELWIPRELRPYLEILDAVPEDIIRADDAPSFQRWRRSHAARRPRVIPLMDGYVTRIPNRLSEKEQPCL